MSPASTIHTAQVLPPRAVLFLGIVAAHALLAWFLGDGLVRGFKSLVAPQPVSLIPLDPKPVDVPRPAKPNPTLDNPLFVPDIEIPPNPTYAQPDAITTTSVPDVPGPVVSPPVVVEPPPIRLVGRHVIPNSGSYYPAPDRRLGREGTAEIQACVSPQGVLSSTPTVERSSGRASLDQAAVRLVGDGRFARAMRGDEPVPNCYRFRVSFTMQ